MAIGDNNNSNLFGTNYNSEEEERKKAELAAQNARMGAGSPTGMGAATPSSTFGQAPASNPFSVQVFEDPSFNTPNSNAIPQTPEEERILREYRAGQKKLNDDNRTMAILSMIGQREGLEKPMSFQDIGLARNAAAFQDSTDRFFGVDPIELRDRLSDSNRDLDKFVNTFAKPNSPQGNFLPYADDVSAPRASALSVFTPGGEVKPNVDVNAITPSPTTLPDPSAVNTALNQEVAVSSPSVNNDPSFMSRLGSFLNPSGSVGGSGGFGLPPTFTPPSEGAALAEGKDPLITPVTLESLGLESAGQKALKESLGQLPSNIDPFTGKTIEKPTPFEFDSGVSSSEGMTANQQAVMNAIAKTNEQDQEVAQDQNETRAALSGMTLNEYLNAPAGTPGVSGLRTDPQGRMITPSAQPPVDSAVPTTVAQPPVDSVVPPAVAQPPVDALSSFEQASLERQQRIGGTGSFEGDSDAREARLRENERQPGESQTERDTRVAQSRTTGSQAGGMSFDDARRRAKGQLAARGVKNPSVSMVNDLARGIQAGEPERLAELETKRAKDAVDLKTAQATLDRPEFEGRVYTVNGVTFAQTSRGGAQVIDTGTETAAESTAKMKDFVFALEQIDKAREAFAAGDTDKANDIFTAAGIQKNGFDVTASEYFGGSATQVTPANPTVSVTGGGLTQQQEAGIQRVMADNKITREEAIKALKESGQLK